MFDFGLFGTMLRPSGKYDPPVIDRQGRVRRRPPERFGYRINSPRPVHMSSEKAMTGLTGNQLRKARKKQRRAQRRAR